MGKTALVVGASGIVGSATAQLLVEQSWSVLGLARNPMPQEGVIPVPAVDEVGPGAALDVVVAVAAVDGVAASGNVGGAIAAEVVVSPAAVDRVVAASADDDIGRVVTGKCVREIRSA